jgi:hypothetical protein
MPFCGHDSAETNWQNSLTILLLNHHKCSWYIPWMIWDDFDGDQWTLCCEAGWFLCWGPLRLWLDSCHILAMIQQRPTDKTAKPLLLDHHKCSWYILFQWMIWDDFDGNQWTLCCEAGWFLCWGLLR